MAKGSAFIFKTLVAFYNDFSVSNVNPLYDANTNHWKKGWSALGYSTSVDIGASWDYRGEILAPGNGNEGWPAIGADPSAATDPSSGDIYVVVLAVSDAAWNTVAVNNESPVFPVTLSDSFCVAASHDGGQTFPEIGCKRFALGPMGTANPGGADRTAITVDGFGRIWVAVANIPPGTTNANLGRQRVFHTPSSSVLNGWIEAPPPQATVRSQILRHDPEGNVWFGSLETPGSGPPGSVDPGVWMQKFDIQANGWLAPKNVSASCGLTISNDQYIPLNPNAMTTFTLRNAHVFDFDVGLAEPMNPTAPPHEVMRIGFQLKRDDDRRFVQVAEYDSSLATPCRTNQVTSSTFQDAGSQFMPSMNFQMRDTDPNWQLVYLNTQNVIDSTGPYVYPTAVKPSTFGQMQQFPVLTLPNDLAPPNWSECTDGAHDFYWGDYFGLTQIKDYQNLWWGVSAFTSSRPNPAACMGAFPQHVASNRW
jgi:hypothetical protein